MIRLGKVSDLDVIDNIALAVIEDMKLSHIPQWDTRYPRKVHYQKDVEKSALFVYELEEHIVGVIVVLPENDPPYETIDGWLCDHSNSLVIHRILVHPNYRNKSIAQQLLDYTIHKGKLGGFQSIKVDTHKGNYKMRRFLEKNHFQYIGFLEVINREAYELLLEEQ